ncbi:MAG: hypothetical protein IT436_00055, partial [Phycisphaerales bacterium]|nr:hypothetical protein [Phycisphaerales bacterium]
MSGRSGLYPEDFYSMEDFGFGEEFEVTAANYASVVSRISAGLDQLTHHIDNVVNGDHEEAEFSRFGSGSGAVVVYKCSEFDPPETCGVGGPIICGCGTELDGVAEAQLDCLVGEYEFGSIGSFIGFLERQESAYNNNESCDPCGAQVPNSFLNWKVQQHIGRTYLGFQPRSSYFATATIYGAAVKEDDATLPGPTGGVPIGNGTWDVIATLSGSGASPVLTSSPIGPDYAPTGLASTSLLYGNYGDIPTMGCDYEGDTYEVCYGWRMLTTPGLWAVVEPTFPEVGASGTPCDASQIVNDPREQTDTEQSDGPVESSTCGDPGPGGKSPGGGPNGRRGGPGRDAGREGHGEDPGAFPPSGSRFDTDRSYTLFPVDLTTGDKRESVTDISVSIPGGSFAISRQYSSRPNYGGSALVGQNWTMSCFGFLTEDEGTLRMEGFGASNHLIYTEASGVWRAGGPTTQTIVETTVAVDGTTDDVWRLEEPGAWSIDFYRGGDFDGLIRQERDIQGNVCTYEYHLFDPSGTKSPRLSAIYLNGTEASGGRAGSIVFKWYLPGYGQPNQGKLQSVIAYQPDDDGDLMQTQRVDYVYHGNPGVTATDLGTGGDLVQVTKWERVDRATTADAPFRQLVTQYRYYRNGYTPAESADERIADVDGGNHQLRLIIQPEQIEYLAQELIAEGQTWTPAEAITETAAYLLPLADDDAVDTEDEHHVIDYASKIVSYESSGDRRVSKQYLQGGCGCSGGGAHGLRASYAYLGTANEPTVVVTEHTLSSGSYTALVDTVRYDLAIVGPGGTPSARPYLKNVVIESPDSRQWISQFYFNPTTHDLEKVYWPSAMREPYTAAGSGTAASVSPSPTGGRVVQYRYTSSGGGHRLAGIDLRDAASSSPAFVRIVDFTYDSTRPWLLTQIERYATSGGSPTADQIETTAFEYGFRTGTDNIAWIKTTIEAETVGENGPGGTYSIYELFDPAGLNVWTRDSQDTLSFNKFDPNTGRLLRVVRNADPAGPGGESVDALDGADFGGVTTTGWGTVSDGGELVTTYKHDALGRISERTSPGGVKSYTVRELWANDGTSHTELERGGVNYLAEISLPHGLSVEPAEVDGPSGVSVYYDGPAIVSLYSAGNRVIQSGDYVVASGAYDPPNLTFTLSTQLAKSTTQHNYLGLTTSKRLWHDVSNDKFYTTTYTYDSIGRVETTFAQAGISGSDLTGTFTKNAAYDVFDRVLEVQVGGGLDSSTPTMTTVASYFYDHTGSDSSPSQGVGDGNLTLLKQFTQETGGTTYSDNERITVRTFDERSRVIKVKHPEPPYEYSEYDNLNRVTKRGLFREEPTVGAGTGVGIDSSERGLYTEIGYSQRGLVYRQRVAVDPEDLGEGYLQTNRWFDGDGRTVAEASPNGPGRKTKFDAHGRAKKTYTTDRYGDAAPGASGSYADATSVDDDFVIQQEEYRYNNAGRLDLVTTRRRVTKFLDDGDLDQSGSIPPAVVTFVGYDYDSAMRRTHTVNFGTNTGADEFTAGGLEPAWPPPSPLVPPVTSGTYQNTLVSRTTFNTRGLPSVSIDPAGKKTHFLYDDLSRRIATVENMQSGFSDSAISWDPSLSGGRWKVTSGLNKDHTDHNRVTSFVYDGMGHTVKQVAHYPDPSSSAEKVQVTEYVYGVDSGTSPASLIGSFDLLREVRYPDESTGEAGTTSAYKVTYSYNAQGELRKVTDQNGTLHEYFRDKAGRVTRDQATVAMSSPIDDTIDKIDVTYDELGRLDNAISLDGSTTLNAVQFTYTPLWQVQHVYQNPLGALTFSSGVPTGTTKAVSYSYDTDTTNNWSRLDGMTYPDGSNVPYSYGAISLTGINHRISRVQAIGLDGLTGPTSNDFLVSYAHVGLDMVSVVDYPTADVQLDRTFSHEGKRYTHGWTTQTAGRYSGWDRFGRVQRQSWLDGETGNDPEVSTTLPTRPPLVEDVYTYDRASNRLSKQDARPGVKWTNTDSQYDYDDLDRLEEARKGKYDASQSWTLAAASQQWSLDMLGNWKDIATDADGNGTYDSSETEERTHDAANQLTERDPPGLFSYPLAYDDAGNITSSKQTSTQTRQYVHDAWNRLVRVKLYKQTVPATTIRLADYRYNPLHWRVLAQVDTNPGGNGIDQQRAMYYSAGWQLVQEDIDDFTNCNPDAGGCTPTPDGINRRAQEFWGLRYIDDPVLRRIGQGTSGWLGANDQAYYHLTDAQFSTVAMITAVGAQLVE